MIDAKTIEELRRLLAKATPGPWVYSDMMPNTYGPAFVDGPDILDLAICGKGTRRSETHGFCLQMHDGESEANAALIVALRNNADALLAERAAPKGQVEAQSTASRDVFAERQRQIDIEGWTPEHDDEHEDYQLASAAACYAKAAAWAGITGSMAMQSVPQDWPWDGDWWKPVDSRRALVKAGALILAEIERLDRSALAAAGAEGV